MSLFGKKQPLGPRTAQEREAARREREAARAKERGEYVEPAEIQPLPKLPEEQQEDIAQFEALEAQAPQQPELHGHEEILESTQAAEQQEETTQATPTQDAKPPDDLIFEESPPQESVSDEQHSQTIRPQEESQEEQLSQLQSGDPLADETFQLSDEDAQKQDLPLTEDTDGVGDFFDTTGDAPAVKTQPKRRHVGTFPSKQPAFKAPEQRLSSGRRIPRRPRWVTRGRMYALILFVIFCTFVWLYSLVFQPFAGDGKNAVAVKVPVGMNAGSVGKLLAKEHVVDSGFIFSVRITLAGKRDQLRAGTFALKRDMSYSDAIRVLTTAPAARPTRKPLTITVTEGNTRRQYATIARKAGLKGSYRKASKRSSVLSPQQYGAPKRIRTLEGFLFPDTYQMKAGSSAQQFVDYQLRTFKQKASRAGLKPSTRIRGLDAYEVLIVASMIERETSVAKERPIIASVIYNRLKLKMVLGIDATIRYQLNNWSSPLRQSQLQADTPYNTRKRQGLVPTPIGNPGYAAIRAALRPAKTSYLYYVAKPGSCGHAFSSTDAEFQQDVARYNTERAKRGGQSPTARGC